MMQLPDLVDGDDLVIIMKGTILCVLAAVVVVASAATAGAAWLVFRLVAGGL